MFATDNASLNQEQRREDLAAYEEERFPHDALYPLGIMAVAVSGYDPALRMAELMPGYGLVCERVLLELIEDSDLAARLVLGTVPVPCHAEVCLASSEAALRHELYVYALSRDIVLFAQLIYVFS